MSNPTEPTVPYSQEAEEAVLGAILVSPNSFVDVASFLDAEDFFLLRNAYIWRGLQRLSKRDEPVDYLTIIQEVKDMGFLDEVGGPAYITHLVNSAPTSTHAEVYGRLVERASIRRAMITASDKIKKRAFDEETPIEEVTRLAENDLLEVTGRSVERRGRFIGEAMSELWDTIDRQLGHEITMLGVTTGLQCLDNLLDGYQDEDLIIVAGRPGMGKTAYTLLAALRVAQAGKIVAIFSVEMSEDECDRRMLAIESGINANKTRKPKTLSGPELSIITNVVGKLGALPIYIDDSPVLRPRDVEARCRWIQKTFGLDIVFIDGIYRMRPDEKHESKVDAVGSIAHGLKDIARKLRIPVFATHQLSRAVEKRQEKRPVLSDLRDSGELEQEADVVIFLYRDVVYNEATQYPNTADFIVAKNRDGKTGVVSAYWEETVTRFSDGNFRQINLSGL